MVDPVHSRYEVTIQFFILVGHNVAESLGPKKVSETCSLSKLRNFQSSRFVQPTVLTFEAKGLGW